MKNDMDNCTLEDYISLVFKRVSLLKKMTDVNHENRVMDAWDNFCDYFIDFWNECPEDEQENLPPSMVTLDAIEKSKQFLAEKDYVNAFEALGIFSSFDLYCIDNATNLFVGRGTEWKNESPVFRSLYNFNKNLLNFMWLLKKDEPQEIIESMMKADFILRYVALHSINEDFNHENSIELYPEYERFLPDNTFWSTIASVQEQDEPLIDKLEDTTVFSEAFLYRFEQQVVRSVSSEELYNNFLKTMLLQPPEDKPAGILRLQEGL